ncbi:MAG: lipocalin family protein [Sphingomonas sp.]|nr:lipocalin family protein [Sphingomonas sp.]
MNLQAGRGRHSSARMAAITGLALAAIALSACQAFGSRHPVGNASVPQPAKAVDIERYLGRWYEIARYEQSFQKGCEGVTADYSLRADGSIEVVNRCRRKDGTTSMARGRAKVAGEDGSAKLKVSFFGPFYGDYWVLDRGDDYSWSIVGEPSGRYLWILAREATPAAQKVKELVGRAQGLGYDTSLLLYTRQP